MKNKFKLTNLVLLLAVIFVTSCQKENIIDTQSVGTVEFTYNVSNIKSSSHEIKPYAAVVSIINESGETIIENRKLKFFDINGSLITEELELKVGNYQISNYILVDAKNEILLMSPMQSDEVADLVNAPLNIGINVTDGQTTLIKPEVLEASRFSKEMLKSRRPAPLNFMLQLYIQDSISGESSLSSGTIKVSSSNTELYSGELGATTNIIYLTDEYRLYTISIEKEGYNAYKGTFTGEELKEHSNPRTDEPLKVVLSPINGKYITFDTYLIDGGLFLLGIKGNNSETVNINWGDNSGFQIVQLSTGSINHNYTQPGSHKIIITGSVEAITYLNIYDGTIGFDIGNAVNLKYLACLGIGIKSLDVSKNQALDELYCSENQLTTLDLSKNTSLRTLDCSDNYLTSLDLSNNNALTNVNCYYNGLKNLNLGNNELLKDISCFGNKLTELNISNTPALRDLYCSYNQLSALDASNNSSLRTLDCTRNQLTTLNIHNGNNAGLTTLDARHNTNLTSICVDNGFESGAAGWTIDVAANYNSICE